MTIFQFLMGEVKHLFRRRRPAAPRCLLCGDEMLLPMEVDARLCLDCQKPAVLRRQVMQGHYRGRP